jgi:2-polyprenyl-6-methoxyphenol hydroxylase-like FAD-dependent oxidoreductase
VGSLTPSEYAQLGQSELEPLLVRYASHHNFDVRFSIELVGVERAAEYIGTVQDLISKSTFKIRSPYFFGADEARSHVAHSLKFNFISKPTAAKACNVLLRADLSHIMNKERHSDLSWILKPDRTTFPGLVVHLRVVRPWKEWVLVAFGTDGTDKFRGLTTESPELIDCVRETLGDDSIYVEILRIDPWSVRHSVAEEYSLDDANLFLGDVAHRHPPAFGLGSNTCVQDAYNLAWKAAFVAKGLAGRGLLDHIARSASPSALCLSTSLIVE